MFLVNIYIYIYLNFLFVTDGVATFCVKYNRNILFKYNRHYHDVQKCVHWRMLMFFCQNEKPPTENKTYHLNILNLTSYCYNRLLWNCYIVEECCEVNRWSRCIDHNVIFMCLFLKYFIIIKFVDKVVFIHDFDIMGSWTLFCVRFLTFWG